jgi:hypothetical protein
MAVPADIPDRMCMETALRIQRFVAQVSDDASPWEPRPEGLPPFPTLGRLPAATTPRSRHEPVTVVCLLPARNCESDLPDWFESVRQFADAVVALDDGSTDDTRRLLAADALVKILLTNPRRETHEGWDDSANRNRLLAAAADLDPDWIISIDSDERIPADDGTALRRFFEEEAEPGHAYAFPVHRMIGDLDHYDGIDFFALRAFAFEPGQEFASSRLHFAPVPTTIADSNWVPTSIRLQHLGGMEASRRRARWAKYRMVDPEHRWEADYSYTVRPPGSVRPWEPRPSGQPVVLSPDAFADLLLDVQEVHGPDLTVVIEAGGTELCEAASDDGRVEVLARSAFELDPDTSRGTARDVALYVARADHVLLVDDAAAVTTGGADAVIAAHAGGAALVGGTVRPPPPSAPRAIVASYLLDDAASLPSGPAPTTATAPRRCSLARQPALLLGGFADADERVLPLVLASRGFTAVRVDGLTFEPASAGTRVSQFVVDRFRLGRSLERALDAEPPLDWTRAPGAGLGRYVWDRLVAMTTAAAGDPEMRGRVLRSAPLVACGLAATAAGSVAERFAAARR